MQSPAVACGFHAVRTLDALSLISSTPVHHIFRNFGKPNEYNPRLILRQYTVWV